MKIQLSIVLVLCVLQILPGLNHDGLAGNINIDSLKRSISTMKMDTLRLKKQVGLVRELTKVNPEMALSECHKARSLAVRLDYQPGLADVDYEFCFIYKQKGDLDSSLFYINRFIKSCEENRDKTRLAKGFLQYGNLIQRKGQLEIARLYFGKSLDLYRQLQDTLSLISVYNAFGIILKRTARHDSATVYFLKALQLSEKKGYKEGIGPILNNLADVYYRLKDYENGRKYSEKSIEINQKLNNLNHVSMAYTTLGSIALDEKKYPEAEKFYNMAADIQKKLGNKIMLYNSYINLGNVFQKKGNIPGASEYYQIALIEFRKTGYQEGIISAMMNQASLLDENRQEKKALILLDSCMVLARKSHSLELIKNIYQKIYLIYAKTGDYRNAYLNQAIYHNLYDSINRFDNERKVEELRLIYDKEKDQARILSLENENLEKDLRIRKRTNQRNIYLLGGLALALGAFSISWYLFHKSKTDKKFAEQKIRQLEEEKKMLAARYIVDGQEEERKRIAKELHDGLGVLLNTIKMQFTSITSYLPENKPVLEKATRLLEQATGDVRRISHNMMPGLLTRFGLFEAVEDIFENLNDIEGLKAHLSITGDQSRLPENMEIMLYRIIQEMVNNTIKHAAATEISFSITRSDDRLHFIYEDNGKGFNVEEALQKKSMGIVSIISRVNFLGGHIEFISSPGQGTHIVFDVLIPNKPMD